MQSAPQTLSNDVAASVDADRILRVANLALNRTPAIAQTVFA